MMDFSNLIAENKTFTKASGGGREQNYTNLKFRFAKKGEIIEGKFTFSAKLFDDLGLAANCLKQFRDKANKVFFVLMPEANETVATLDGVFLKKRNDKDGKYTKGHVFKNTFLLDNLQAAGIIDAADKSTQYIDLVEVKDVANLPDYMLGVYELVKGEKIADAEVEEEEEVVVEENEEY